MTNDNSMTKPSGRPERIWLVIALVFIVFWILYLVLLGPRAPVATLENSGMRPPADVRLDGARFERSAGAVFPVQREDGLLEHLGHLVRALRRGDAVDRPTGQGPRLQGKGIEFVCVSTDDSSEDVRRFLRAKSWGMTFLRAERLPGVFFTGGFPATFIIAPDGRIAAAIEGADRWDTPEVVAFLEKIASGAPLPSAR